MKIHQKLNRIKQVNINEEAFTYSLRKVHDKSFIEKLLPSISNQQNKFSPQGASQSKSPNLLRNTFNIEMYAEFQRQRAHNPEELSEEDE